MEHQIELTADSLWDEVASRLKGALNEATFGSWFGSAEGVALSDDAFTLSVPNDFTREWIEGHFLGLIRAAVKDATGHERRIHLSVRDESDLDDLRVRLVAHAQVDPALVPGRVLDRGADQAEEMALDPLAAVKSFGNRERERVVGERDALGASPNQVPNVASLSAPSEPTRHLVPQTRPQSARFGAPRCSRPLQFARPESGEHSSVPGAPSRCVSDPKSAGLHASSMSTIQSTGVEDPGAITSSKVAVCGPFASGSLTVNNRV